MKYLCLIYDNEATTPKDGPEADAVFKAYWAFQEEVMGAGAFLAGEALESVTTATTVRVREGDTITTDGPFAETKEQLGGFYLFECANLDEALAWAAKIPTAKTGSIEVRPVWNVMG